MGKFGKAALFGAAVLSVAGAAMAAGHYTHEMKVALPDGSIARIEYTGDVAPRVSVTSAVPVAPVAFLNPFDPVPFMDLDRVSDQMEEQASALMRQVDAMRTAASDANAKPQLAASANLPAGTGNFTFISIGNGKGTGSCYRSVQVTSDGSGAHPKIVSNREGNCDALDRMTAPASKVDPSKSAEPKTPFGTATTAQAPALSSSV